MDTTAGPASPLTFERFRIVELYAELLHCSNMAVLNRPFETGPSYDVDGRLVGGLAGLDLLSTALSTSDGNDAVTGSPPSSTAAVGGRETDAATAAEPTPGSVPDDPSTSNPSPAPPGDLLKRQFIDQGILTTLLVSDLARRQ